MMTFTPHSIGDRTRAEKRLSEGEDGFEAGDLVWIDLNPRTGREQSGRRPAVIVSPALFWQASRFAIVCPITTTVRPFASSVVLPAGLPISGEILTSHVRSIDTLARPITAIGARVPPALLAELRAKLAALMGID